MKILAVFCMDSPLVRRWHINKYMPTPDGIGSSGLNYFSRRYLLTARRWHAKQLTPADSARPGDKQLTVRRGQIRHRVLDQIPALPAPQLFLIDRQRYSRSHFIQKTEIFAPCAMT